MTSSFVCRPTKQSLKRPCSSILAKSTIISQSQPIRSQMNFSQTSALGTREHIRKGVRMGLLLVGILCVCFRLHFRGIGVRDTDDISDMTERSTC